MRFFGNIFGRHESFHDLKPSSQMMDENQFWSLINNSISKTNDQAEQEGKLINALKRLSPNEIIGFRLRTDQLLHTTYNSEMWCAANIILSGCSDDMFEYFRLWVISLGKHAYYNAKANPDSLVNSLSEESEYEFESLWYVANTAFHEKTQLDMYDYIDHENFPYGEGKYPQFDFTWSGDNYESQKAICPELCSLFFG